MFTLLNLILSQYYNLFFFFFLPSCISLTPPPHSIFASVNYTLNPLSERHTAEVRNSEELKQEAEADVVVVGSGLRSACE